MSSLKEDLVLFREHARLMRKQGFTTVFVKSATREFSAILETPETKELPEAVSPPIGFAFDEDDECDDAS